MTAITVRCAGREVSSSAAAKGPLRRSAAAWVLSGLLLLALAGPAAAEKERMADYDTQDAGHPVRIAAYVIHPFGVLLNNLVFRPAYWLGTHEPLKTLFGVTD